MNHLAHVALAAPCPASLLGNLLGDFVRGVDLAGFPPPVREGIDMHREVDRFTDAHPVFRAARGRIAPERRRFAGILVDVFFDHFLCRHWSTFRPDVPLRTFTRGVYAVLADHAPLLPERLAHAAPRMAADDWLAALRELPNVERALIGLGRRMRRPNPLASGLQDLAARYDPLERDFLAFFPDLAAHAAQLRGRCVGIR